MKKLLVLFVLLGAPLFMQAEELSVTITNNDSDAYTFTSIKAAPGSRYSCTALYPRQTIEPKGSYVATIKCLDKTWLTGKKKTLEIKGSNQTTNKPFSAVVPMSGGTGTYTIPAVGITSKTAKKSHPSLEKIIESGAF